MTELDLVRLKAACKAACLTQDEVGAAVGISRAYLSDIEKGKKTGSLIMLIDLAKLYDISFDSLCGIAPSPDDESVDYRVHDIEERRLLGIWRIMDKRERLNFMSSLAVYLSAYRRSSSVSHMTPS